MSHAARAARRFLSWICCLGTHEIIDLSDLEIEEHEVVADLLSGRD